MNQTNIENNNNIFTQFTLITHDVEINTIFIPLSICT